MLQNKKLGKEEWKYLPFIHPPHPSKHASTDNISSGLENSSDNIMETPLLQSLLGKLNFVAQCVKPGRIFISRLLNWLREISDKGSFCIPLDLKLDLLWWNTFLPLYNVSAILLSQPEIC
jgi:hypothetical protein